MPTRTQPSPTRGRSLAVSLARAALVAVVVCAVLPAVLGAQVRIPDEALPDNGELQRVLAKGHELESQHRWGEALAHYEHALREHPDERSLQERLTYARIHFDIGRRYQDESFLATLRELNERRAADLYAEVLRKIHLHYVKEPNWQEISRRGLASLNTALSRSSFQKQHGLTASDAGITRFCDEMQRRMDVTVIRNREQAGQAAATVARQAAEQLTLRPEACLIEFTCGAICALDEYSSFLTGGQLEEVFSQIEGNFVGLGIELKAHDDSLSVVSVIPGSPAEAAGIRGGDRIVEVDGSATANVTTDEAANLLKGREGSQVHLTVVDPSGRARQMDIIRRRVEVPSVEDARIVDPEYGTGYVRLAGFQKTTSRDVDAALWRLHRAGMRSLVIDLRGNPGGLLTAAVDLADKFVASGNIVATRGRSPQEDFDYRARTGGTWQMPLAVLIDGETASASEIFAGAVRDHHRGTVIGQRSYGKGSVQGIFPLTTVKAGVRLTTAKFYSPSGQPITNRGVFPDVVVQTVKKPAVAAAGADRKLQPEEYTVLAAALQFMRSRLTQRRPARQ